MITLKRLYFTIEKQTYDDDETLTGWKVIYVYKVVCNVIQKFFTLEIENDHHTMVAIREYLDENGYESQKIIIEQL